jgi:hypothetical protein
MIKRGFMDEQRWLTEKWADLTIKNLKKNYMNGCYFPSAEAALPKILEHIPPGALVGLGDSMTLHQTGVVAALAKGNYRLLDPWALKDMSQKIEMQRQILTADVYLVGTNALTLSGELINVDGRGNRVAALIFGPKKVLVVVGVNKIVRDIEEGFKRVKSIAGPANAKRHKFPKGKQPPCAVTGFCSECKAPFTICCALTVIRGQRMDKERITVFIIGAEFGL